MTFLAKQIPLAIFCLLGVSTININFARDIHKFDDFGKPVSRSSCPYSDLKCLINVDATVDIEMRKSTFDEMINFGQANVKMALGQSSDFLLHKLDVSMAQARFEDVSKLHYRLRTIIFHKI